MRAFFPGNLENVRNAKVRNLQDSVRIDEQVLGFQIAMRDPDGMKVLDADDELLEVTVDFRLLHHAGLDGLVQVTVRTVFHDLTPVLVLILYQIDRLDDILVMQSRRNAKLARQPLYF